MSDIELRTEVRPPDMAVLRSLRAAQRWLKALVPIDPIKGFVLGGGVAAAGLLSLMVWR